MFGFKKKKKKAEAAQAVEFRIETMKDVLKGDMNEKMVFVETQNKKNASFSGKKKEKDDSKEKIRTTSRSKTPSSSPFLTSKVSSIPADQLVSRAGAKSPKEKGTDLSKIIPSGKDKLVSKAPTTSSDLLPKKHLPPKKPEPANQVEKRPSKPIEIKAKNLTINLPPQQEKKPPASIRKPTLQPKEKKKQPPEQTTIGIATKKPAPKKIERLQEKKVEKIKIVTKKIPPRPAAPKTSSPLLKKQAAPTDLRQSKEPPRKISHEKHLLSLKERAQRLSSIGAPKESSAKATPTSPAREEKTDSIQPKKDIHPNNQINLKDQSSQRETAQADKLAKFFNKEKRDKLPTNTPLEQPQNKAAKLQKPRKNMDTPSLSSSIENAEKMRDAFLKKLQQSRTPLPPTAVQSEPKQAEPKVEEKATPKTESLSKKADLPEKRPAKTPIQKETPMEKKPEPKQEAPKKSVASPDKKRPKEDFSKLINARIDIPEELKNQPALQNLFEKEAQKEEEEKIEEESSAKQPEATQKNDRISLGDGIFTEGQQEAQPEASPLLTKNIVSSRKPNVGTDVLQQLKTTPQKESLKEPAQFISRQTPFSKLYSQPSSIGKDPKDPLTQNQAVEQEPATIDNGMKNEKIVGYSNGIPKGQASVQTSPHQEQPEQSLAEQNVEKENFVPEDAPPLVRPRTAGALDAIVKQPPEQNIQQTTPTQEIPAPQTPPAPTSSPVGQQLPQEKPSLPQSQSVPVPTPNQAAIKTFEKSNQPEKSAQQSELSSPAPESVASDSTKEALQHISQLEDALVKETPQPITQTSPQQQTPPPAKQEILDQASPLPETETPAPVQEQKQESKVRSAGTILSTKLSQYRDKVIKKKEGKTEQRSGTKEPVLIVEKKSRINKPLLALALVMIILTVTSGYYYYKMGVKGESMGDIPFLSNVDIPNPLKDFSKTQNVGPVGDDRNLTEAEFQNFLSSDMTASIKSYITSIKNDPKKNVSLRNGYFLKPRDENGQTLSSSQVLESLDIEIQETYEYLTDEFYFYIIRKQKKQDQEESVVKINLFVRIDEGANHEDLEKDLKLIEQALPSELQVLFFDEEKPIIPRSVSFKSVFTDNKIAPYIRYFNFSGVDTSKSIEWGVFTVGQQKYLGITTSKHATDSMSLSFL